MIFHTIISLFHDIFHSGHLADAFVNIENSRQILLVFFTQVDL